MKQVHHIVIIGQPAFVEGLTTNCPHCNQLALVREDGSALCINGNIDFAPEHADEMLFAMRQDFDRRHGIDVTQRHLIVPSLQHASGYIEDEARQPQKGFHPQVMDALQRFTGGHSHIGGLNRAQA